jgi:hypothetical protein
VKDTGRHPRGAPLTGPESELDPAARTIERLLPASTPLGGFLAAATQPGEAGSR